MSIMDRHKKLSTCMITRAILVWTLLLQSYDIFPASLQQLQLKSNAPEHFYLRIKKTQATLNDLLSEIGRQTGTIFHSANLPNNKFDVSCEGDLKTVLQCLVGVNANIVFRYKDNVHLNTNKHDIAEVWILPELTNDNQAPTRLLDNKYSIEPVVDNIDRLLEEVKNPLLKVNAIERLAIEGTKDDARISNVLKHAFSDRDPVVRSQAIFGLGRLGVSDITDLLQHAMADADVDVRLMALEVSGIESPILKLALDDVNSAVREFATIKLALQNNN